MDQLLTNHYRCHHCDCEWVDEGRSLALSLCPKCSAQSDPPIRSEEAPWFLNHYRCYECEQEWLDEWSCGCDDDCPNCGARHCTPYLSEALNEAAARLG